MMTSEYDSFGPIHTQPQRRDDGPSSAPRLRAFMRRARTATHVSVAAVILSIPGWGFMDFDTSKHTPGWAAVLFTIGALGLAALFLLIPARVAGRIALFALGDGTSRSDARLRIVAIVVIAAIASVAVTITVVTNRQTAPAYTSVTAVPTTIPVSPTPTTP